MPTKVSKLARELAPYIIDMVGTGGGGTTRIEVGDGGESTPLQLTHYSTHYNGQQYTNAGSTWDRTYDNVWVEVDVPTLFGANATNTTDAGDCKIQVNLGQTYPELPPALELFTTGTFEILAASNKNNKSCFFALGIGGQLQIDTAVQVDFVTAGDVMQASFSWAGIVPDGTVLSIFAGSDADNTTLTFHDINFLVHGYARDYPVYVEGTGQQSGGMAVHDLDGPWHTGTLAEAQAPWAVTTTGFSIHTGNPNAHHAEDHDIVGDTHAAPGGLQGQLIGLSHNANLKYLTPGDGLSWDLNGNPIVDGTVARRNAANTFIEYQIIDNGLTVTGDIVVAGTVDGVDVSDLGDAFGSHIVADIGDAHPNGLLAWLRVSKTGSNLTDLETREHGGLQNVLPDQHHEPVTVGEDIELFVQHITLGQDVARLDKSNVWQLEQKFVRPITLPLWLGEHWVFDESGNIQSTGDNAYNDDPATGIQITPDGNISGNDIDVRGEYVLPMSLGEHWIIAEDGSISSAGENAFSATEPTAGMYFSPEGYFEAQRVKIRGEFGAAVFAVEETVLHGGSDQWTPGGAAVLNTDMTIGAPGTTVTFDVLDGALTEVRRLIPRDILEIKTLADLDKEPFTGYNEPGWEFGTVGSYRENYVSLTVHAWFRVDTAVRTEGGYTYTAEVLKNSSPGAHVRAGAGIANLRNTESSPFDLGYVKIIDNDNFSPRMEFGLYGQEPWNDELYPFLVAGRLDGTALVNGRSHGVLIATDATDTDSAFILADTKTFMSRRVIWSSGDGEKETVRIDPNGRMRLGGDVADPDDTALDFDPSRGLLSLRNAGIEMSDTEQSLSIDENGIQIDAIKSRDIGGLGFTPQSDEVPRQIDFVQSLGDPTREELLATLSTGAYMPDQGSEILFTNTILTAVPPHRGNVLISGHNPDGYSSIVSVNYDEVHVSAESIFLGRRNSFDYSEDHWWHQPSVDVPSINLTDTELQIAASKILIQNLPESDPQVAGEMYWNNNTLTRSVG